ncbi:hypothetical protein Scani_79460 [Streptomyces caniferus]|uniref:Uncharacterized protein n=1 Tax=Streptomyces caniferus TaxID=285557 RepID=A0A640SKR2_9ACTN|nr:hypothetical protein Scani_79460 [Streptomyces caniferus]
MITVTDAVRAPRRAISVTSYSWWVQLTEMPLPDPLAQLDWAILPLGLQPGLPALEALLCDGEPVGPVLCCPRHRRLYAPVAAECRHSLEGERLGVRGRDLSCPVDDRHRGGCDGRLWLLPSDPRHLTDLVPLADRMMRVSSARRLAAAACA